MEYRSFGNTGKEVSVLGFGAMRLPHEEKGRNYRLLLERSIELMEKAVAGGINYIDTAYPYCHGESEKAVGRFLEGKKEKIYISSKSPLWMIKKEGDFRAFLEESLGKLGIDTIDFYHMHSLNEMLYKEKVVRFDLLGKAQKAKDEGLISHISFSFHDKPEMLKEMADLGVFDSVLCQYNFLDRTNQEAISYAKSKGLGIAVMGPLAGGRIFDTVSAYNIERDRLARLALGFVVSNKDVDIAISGMEDITVLKKNLEALEGFEALGKDEKGLLDRIFSDKKTGQMIPCNNCGYCVPCPEDVAIPEIFKIYNYYKMTDLLGNSRFQYRKISEVLEKNTGEACIRCGECEEKCPQKIGIMDKLEDIEKTFKV